MSAFIHLEDGRTLQCPTVVMTGVFWRVSQQVSPDYPKLKRWLADLSRRPVPFMDLEIAGLLEPERNEFYAAVRRAMQNEYSGKSGGSTEALNTLLKMKACLDRGEPPLSLSDSDEVHRFSGEIRDLEELWGLADEPST